jgi:alpha-mannosidase
MIVHMIGNAHIDPVWLWPWQAGVDEALATVRSAADRCDEYPEFIFTRGEAWVYQQVERIDPELFGRVERLIARGQWHITGGQYIQPDSNLPTEMGWRRQILHGRRYFEEHFGISPTIAYNVDSFGHPATLPDILADLGYEGFVFHRPGLHQVELPAQTFRWQGVGGGEVLGFRIIPSYTTTQTNDLGERVEQAIEATDPQLGHTMCFYGVGNHGGGPTKDNIEWILAHRAFAPGVELRFSTPQAFFDAVSTRREVLPEVSVELQKTFPGCYSVMHDIKQAQIRGEHLLDQAERVINRYVGEPEREAELRRLDAAWEDLLFTEFHDILAGTSIPSAWKSVRAMHGRAWITGEEIILDATRRWARSQLPPVDHQQLVVINSDPAPWDGLVEAEPWLDFDPWGARWLSDRDGNPVPFQQVQPEAQLAVSRITFPLHVEAGGSSQLLIRDDPPPANVPGTDTDLDVSTRHLANRHLRLKLEPWGIGGLEVGGNQVLGTDGWTLQLREDHTDTWTFHTDRFDEPVRAHLSSAGWALEETGPLRARVRLNGTVGDSPVRWTLTLNRDDPRLFLLLECTFIEQLTLLQMPIALAAPPSRWTDGLAGGQVEHAVNATEWPVQGWSRVRVGETELAIVTNDAYSLSMPGDRWQWTLLRSPKMAWMEGYQPPVYAGRDWHTDQGAHTFAFVLLAGDSLPDERLHTAARQQAQPPIVFDRYEGLDRPRRVAQDPPEIAESGVSTVP